MSQASMIWMERKVVALDLARKKALQAAEKFPVLRILSIKNRDCTECTNMISTVVMMVSWGEWSLTPDIIWIEWLSTEGKILGLQHENKALGWWNYLYLVNLKSSVSPHHQQPSMIVQMTPYGSVWSAEPSLKCRSLLSCSTPSSQTLLTFTADFTSLIQIQPR